ncbi:MAG: DUF4145 domain-containing protein [Bryobacteraceae bacterium]
MGKEISLSLAIPEQIRRSLFEAHTCLKSKAYIASVVMSGRALESICHHFETKSMYLNGGLKELLQSGIIDTRLFEWSEELRKHRNIAAHASSEEISGDDASDLFDFVVAICEYVFVLATKFHKFMQRKDRPTAKPPRPIRSVSGTGTDPGWRLHVSDRLSADEPALPESGEASAIHKYTGQS